MPPMIDARDVRANHSSTDARIVATKLSYALPDGRELLHDLTIAFGRERTGPIGPNGSGKTTLLRLLAGELQASSGAVHRTGTLAMLPQEFRPEADDTLAVVLGINDRLQALRRMGAGEATLSDLEVVGDDWDIAERAASVLARFGLGHLLLDCPAGALSGGETTRIALAGLTLARPDFLLLDEPTNHLDSVSRDALNHFVEGWGGGLICVSHDRLLLRRMDRTVELSSLGVHSYGGGYDFYRARRDADVAAAEREMASAAAAVRLAERDAREVRERQARRAAQGRRDGARGGMPRIVLGARSAQAQVTDARVRAVTEREVDERRMRAAAARRLVEEREPPRFDMTSTRLPAGRTVLDLEQVTVRFPGVDRPVLQEVSLRMVGSERVAVSGPNGSGKTMLLRVAMGRLEPDGGTVRRLPDEETAYLDQRGAALDPRLSVLDNFRFWHPRMEPTATRHALARFLFSHEAALQTVGTLSGGQRLRLSLACVLGGERPPSLLVLDEPSNHLDLDALEALESALCDHDGALLVVSHDASFLRAIAVERYLSLDG